MAIDIQLTTPSNYSNPVSVEAAFLRNNEAIKVAFEEALSRNGGERNFLWTDLDFNGNDILNVGAHPFLTQKDLVVAQVGSVVKNTATNSIEYINQDGFVTTLFTADELRGEDGLDGNGAGDMVAADNLSGLPDYAAARSNLGLEIGSDVQAHNPALDNFSPSNMVTSNDPRFESYPIRIVSTDITMDTWGRMYRNDGAVDKTITIAPASDGNVNSVYVHPFAGTLTLTAGTGVQLYRAGSTTLSGSIDLPAGCFATIVCVSSDGLTFLISGV